jgi:hypothetical protein
VQRVDAGEYLERMERAGRFSADAPVPEHNVRVWRRYWSLRGQWLGAPPPEPVLLFEGLLGFSLDPLDAERDGWNWALTTPIVDPCIPITEEAFVRALPRLQEALEGEDVTVLTDTFCLTDGYPRAPAPHLLAVQSPVAQLRADQGSYLATLSRRRRQNQRRLLRRFGGSEHRLELGPRPLSDHELSAAARNLEARWGQADAPYALLQTLWAQAVALEMPERALVARLYLRDRLVFVQTMIVRGTRVLAQSIFKEEEAGLDGVGPHVDLAVAGALCGGPSQVFDPSSRATWIESGDIWIAKRATINAEQIKPLLAVGPRLPATAASALRAGQVAGLRAQERSDLTTLP